MTRDQGCRDTNGGDAAPPCALKPSNRNEVSWLTPLLTMDSDGEAQRLGRGSLDREVPAGGSPGRVRLKRCCISVHMDGMLTVCSVPSRADAVCPDQGPAQALSPQQSSRRCCGLPLTTITRAPNAMSSPEEDGKAPLTPGATDSCLPRWPASWQRHKYQIQNDARHC